MELEPVEARLDRPARRPNELAADPVHVGPVHRLGRRPARPVRERRGSERRPRALLGRRAARPRLGPRGGGSSPCGRRARAEVRSWRSCARERTRPPAARPRRARAGTSPRSRARSAPRPRRRSSRRSPARHRRARGCPDGRGASRRSSHPRAEYWHIGETTIRFASSIDRTRNGVNAGGGASFPATGRSAVSWKSIATAPDSSGSRRSSSSQVIRFERDIRLKVKRSGLWPR